MRMRCERAHSLAVIVRRGRAAAGGCIVTSRSIPSRGGESSTRGHRAHWTLRMTSPASVTGFRRTVCEALFIRIAAFTQLRRSIVSLNAFSTSFWCPAVAAIVRSSLHSRFRLRVLPSTGAWCEAGVHGESVVSAGLVAMASGSTHLFRPLGPAAAKGRVHTRSQTCRATRRYWRPAP